MDELLAQGEGFVAPPQRLGKLRPLQKELRSGRKLGQGLVRLLGPAELRIGRRQTRTCFGQRRGAGERL
jgi:hypothetical protein